MRLGDCGRSKTTNWNEQTASNAVDGPERDKKYSLDFPPRSHLHKYKIKEDRSTLENLRNTREKLGNTLENRISWSRNTRRSLETLGRILYLGLSLYILRLDGVRQNLESQPVRLDHVNVWEVFFTVRNIQTSCLDGLSYSLYNPVCCLGYLDA